MIKLDGNLGGFVALTRRYLSQATNSFLGGVLSLRHGIVAAVLILLSSHQTDTVGWRRNFGLSFHFAACAKWVW